MFSGASSFNQPLNDWNTSKVTDMAHMFHGAKKFYQPLDKWDTTEVTDVEHMFTGAKSTYFYNINKISKKRKRDDSPTPLSNVLSFPLSVFSFGRP